MSKQKDISSHKKNDLMKLIICSLSIVLLAIGINLAYSQISNETNTTLSLPAHGNQNFVNAIKY